MRFCSFSSFAQVRSNCNRYWQGSESHNASSAVKSIFLVEVVKVKKETFSPSVLKEMRQSVGGLKDRDKHKSNTVYWKGGESHTATHLPTKLEPNSS